MDDKENPDVNEQEVQTLTKWEDFFIPVFLWTLFGRRKNRH